MTNPTQNQILQKNNDENTYNRSTVKPPSYELLLNENFSRQNDEMVRKTPITYH